MTNPVLEIRTYRLVPGTRDTFHALVSTGPIPALARYGVRVVDYGPSLVREDGHDEYYLMRVFASLAERDRLERAFYTGDEWREQWRDKVLACVETFHTIVCEVTPAAVDAMTRQR